MIVVFLSEWRKLNMALVGIVMGSDSDMPVMAKAAEMLDRFGIDYEMKIISAHREPDVFFEYAKSAEEKGFKVDEESVVNAIEAIVKQLNTEGLTIE